MIEDRAGGTNVAGLSRAVCLALILGACACGDKIDPEAEAAKVRSDLQEAAARLRNHKVKDAEKIYLRVIEKYPNLPEEVKAKVADAYSQAEFGMARVRFAENDLASAEVLLKRVTEALPENSKAQAKLGEVYALLDRPAESATYYGKAFTLEPDNGAYGLGYGIGLKESKQYPEAEKVFLQVAEIDPMARFVYTELGDVVRFQNRLDEALKLYMKAQNTYRSDKMARAGAAFVYEAKGDPIHALDEWSAYIRMDCCSDYSNDVAKKKITDLQAAAQAQATGGAQPPANEPAADGQTPAAAEPAPQ